MAATAPPPMYWAQGQAGAPQPVMMAPQVAQAGAPQPGVMMAPQVAQAGAPQLGVMMAPQVAQGSVAFYPHANQQIIMVQQPPDYNYKPASYLVLSIVMTVLCSLFSPLMLTLTVPAILFARRSQASHKMGNIKLARNQGVVAAYLNVFAVIIAFVVALLVTGLVIGLYSPVYYLQQCKDEHDGGYYYSCGYYY